MRIKLIAPLLCLFLTAPALAQDNTARRDTALRAARDFVIPRYETLAQATKAELEAWTRFCAAPKADEIGALKDSYQKAADAWSGIEFVLYGPISTDFRFERMAHWPERKNAIGRGLSNVLARKGSEDLTPGRFAQTSAAVQGFSALERLLYEPNAATAFTNGSEEATRRCGVAVAIAGNLARTSTQVLDEWTRPDGALAALEKGDDAKIEEAATRLSTDYLGLFDIVDDQKLGAVMGDSVDNVKPTLAESWRSGRSMRAIAINLEAAEALGRILVDPSTDEGNSLGYALRTARGMAETAPADIGKAAADPKERRNLILLRDAVHSLRETAQNAVTTALGISLGFNSRDGD
ncbi:imelysin family protein [Microvirga puerhi]|uniref:Imelysin family protein n=1 Tax=Microvirga puerhi TaxID=2876078 RepID=A0ABS7VT65_9HYPH|nr:imelysin family protein [Microvirga puerhi]MBZ6078754.1 imelysin family protein [Microvirga puerhi]